MNDETPEEHENQPPRIFGFPFQIGPSPEVIEQQQMEGEANAHETREFLDSLTEAQLRKFASIMGLAGATDGTAATYYLGVAAGILDWKYKSCLACGKNHDKPFEEMAPLEEDSLEASKRRHPAGKKLVLRECCGTMSNLPHTYQCPFVIQYDMEPDDGGTLNIMCKNCKKWYTSLEDRMLRPPGKQGCPGCIQKEKWG